MKHKSQASHIQQQFPFLLNVMKGKPKKSEDSFKNKGKECSYQKNMAPAQCEKHFPFDLFPLSRVNNQINPNDKFEAR